MKKIFIKTLSNGSYIRTELSLQSNGNYKVSGSTYSTTYRNFITSPSYYVSQLAGNEMMDRLIRKGYVLA